MGEIESLVGVLREVDRVLARDPAHEAVVSGLMPAETVDEPLGIVPGVEAALNEMARTPPSPEHLYPRVLACGALARADPERFRWRGSERHRTVAALRPLTPDGDHRQPQVLHRLLDEAVPTLGDDAPNPRRALFSAGHTDGVPKLHRISGESTLIENRGAIRGRIVTFDPLAGCRLEDVAALFDPLQWYELSGKRIEMVFVPPADQPRPGDAPERPEERRSDAEEDRSGGRQSPRQYQQIAQYQEILKVRRLRLSPLLEVVQRPEVNYQGKFRVAWLEYRLAQEQSAREPITVDEGSIVVREVEDGLRITTTKRIHFAPPFDGPALALLAKAIGYFDAFEEMVDAAVAFSPTPAG